MTRTRKWVMLLTVVALVALSWLHATQRADYIAKEELKIELARASNAGDRQTREALIAARQQYVDTQLANVDWRYNSLKVGTAAILVIALATIKREQAS